RFILTAAHCVEPSVFSDGWTINDLRVLVKNPTMNDVFVDEFKDVRSITIHPNYEPSDLWINDIAVLELTHPITDNVQSITLPQDFG
ncbi:trypsin-like serine protease, partial [Klebsiella pneumoniae]